MEISLNELTKRIYVSTSQTHESIKNRQEVNPKILQQLVEDIGTLKDKTVDAHVQLSSILPHIQGAIESLTGIELMIEKMKENETDNLVQSIRKVIMGELEENAREQVSNIVIPYNFFHEKITDLKSFLKAKQKVEKIYKPKTQ